MNTALLVAGVALLLVALLSRWVTIGGNQIAKGAPWWVPVVVGAAGVLAIAWALAASREQLPALRTVPGFLGAPPKMLDPRRLVSRPDLSQKIVAMLRVGGGPVALTGIGGAGKSTLAAGACLDRRVRRRFRDGVTWLETGPGQDPVALLGGLGRRLGLPESETGFTTVAQGRDKIAAVLAGKRMLIAVDNVWKRGPLDALTGLAPGCTVLFTTRLPALAATFGAAQVRVNELPQGKALELLARWTGQARAELPDVARALCVRVGNLPLGVAMAGSMVARGQSFTDVLALIEQDLTRVRADLDPAYQHRDLLAAIEAGISDLPVTAQHQYALLAVFAGRGAFPREAAAVLWQPDLMEADVGDLLAELADRSLLTAAGDGWYTAHDLQYDVLGHRLGRDRLAAAHARLVEGYRTRYPGGWAGSAIDPYLAGALAGHLHDAGRADELRALLADVAWIQRRLADGQLPALLADYRYASDSLTRVIVRALRLSAQVVVADPGQVRGQLAGRLLGHPDPPIADWAAGLIRDGGPGPWLAPLIPALTSPATALQQTLIGHDSQVMGVAITPDGTRAVSGGLDGTVRVWDLATGRQQAKLIGQDDPVMAVAVTADGTRAVSVQADGVRVWNLATGRQETKFTGHRGPPWAVAVSADGTRAVSGGEDRTVRVWDLATGRQQAKIIGAPDWVKAVAITADGTRVVTADAYDGAAQVWDLATGRELTKFIGHHGPVKAVAVTADGTRAVSGGEDRTVRVWDLATGREQAMFTGHRGRVAAVAVTADGTRAVSGGSGLDGTVRVWDLVAGREQAMFAGHTNRVEAVAVTADGTRAVSGGEEGTVRVWDLAAGPQPTTSAGHVGPVLAVAVTADGTWAVSGGEDRTVRVWDLASGREQAKLTGHRGEVCTVAAGG